MDELLSVSDAARILGVTPTTVRLMERTGQLPALRTAGGMRLFQRVDVERLATARRGEVLKQSNGRSKPACGSNQE